jgi:hypothetical protein
MNFVLFLFIFCGGGDPSVVGTTTTTTTTVSKGTEEGWQQLLKLLV